MACSRADVLVLGLRALLEDPDGELPDPIGMGQSTYDPLGERLMTLIPERLEALLNNEDEKP